MTKPVQAVRKAVFPVAGLGTRLLPATKVMPKEMLTVVDRPLIQLAVEEAIEAGIEEFIFVTSIGKEMLVQHFADAPELMRMLQARGKTEQIAKVQSINLPEGALKTVIQEQPLGLGHAVWCAEKLVGHEPFAVILPDDVIQYDQGCLSQMMAIYQQRGGNVIATCQVERHDTARYGILDVGSREDDVVTIRGLVEKPKPEQAPSNLAIIGRYILQPELFQYLARHERGAGGEIQITDAMAHLLKEQAFHGFLFKGERLDCGSDKGFVMAQIAAALANPAIASEVAHYMTQKLAIYQNEEQSSQNRTARAL